ncbi:2459_t:CDS:2 [Entrophospora sp. SA101]|nr:2459_t:CDS:2 [Entrophospora sp. SA101]
MCKKIDSFDNLSTSTQRSRVISIGQSILQTFENSKSSALNINKNLEQATLVKTTFETNGTQYELTYDKKNSNAEEEAIVKVLDEHNIEKKNQSEKIPIFTFNTSFEKTVKSVTNDMDIDDDTEEISENILVAEESHGNGVRRNIKDILYSLIPYFIENGILKDNFKYLQIKVQLYQNLAFTATSTSSSSIVCLKK